jgi:hypothetical protein
VTISTTGALLSAFLKRFVCPRLSPNGTRLLGRDHNAGKAGTAPIFRLGEETIVVIVALFAAFLLGIVVGSGLEILVRSRVPSA